MDYSVVTVCTTRPTPGLDFARVGRVVLMSGARRRWRRRGQGRQVVASYRAVETLLKKKRTTIEREGVLSVSKQIIAPPHVCVYVHGLRPPRSTFPRPLPCPRLATSRSTHTHSYSFHLLAGFGCTRLPSFPLISHGADAVPTARRRAAGAHYLQAYCTHSQIGAVQGTLGGALCRGLVIADCG